MNKRGLLAAILLVGAVLLASTVMAERERLSSRENEIRWRLAGYVKAGLMPTADAEEILSMVINESWQSVTVKKGVSLSNWYVRSSSEKAREFRPKGRTYVFHDETTLAVFQSPRLVKPRAFMIGEKRCFNFIGYVPPPIKEVPPSEPKPQNPCVTLRVCKDTQNGGVSAGREFLLQIKQGDDWKPVATLVTDANGQASTELRQTGKYRLEEINLPEDYLLVVPDNGYYEFVITPGQVGEVKRLFVNRYCPKPQKPCVTLRVCKDTQNGGVSAGREFLLQIKQGDDWSTVTTLVTDANGQASTELRQTGKYRLEEINLPEDYLLVVPDNGYYEFVITPGQVGEVKRLFVNRYCPKQTPVKPNIPFEDLPEEEPVRVRFTRPLLPQGNASPGESVRQQELATFGLGAAGNVNSRRVRCGRCGSSRPCVHRPGPIIPPEGVVPRTKPPFRPIRPGTGRLPGGY